MKWWGRNFMQLDGIVNDINIYICMYIDINNYKKNNKFLIHLMLLLTQFSFRLEALVYISSLGLINPIWAAGTWKNYIILEGNRKNMGWMCTGSPTVENWIQNLVVSGRE